MTQKLELHPVSGKEPQGPVSAAEIENIARRVDFSPVHGADILLIGGQGMLGNYAAQAILEASRLQDSSPRSFISMGRRPPDETMGWSAKFPNFQYLVEDISYSSVFPHSDFFLHFASSASPTKYQSEAALWQANIGGAIGALGAGAGPEKTLFVSSGEVYGAGRAGGYSEGVGARIVPHSPRSAYPNSKLATEFLLRGWAENHDKSLRIGRVFHTFGPGLRRDDGRVFGDILWSAYEGRDIELRSTGTAERNFAYIEDTVVGLFALLFAEGHVLSTDIGGSERLTILDFAQKAASLSGVNLVLPAGHITSGPPAVQGSPPLPDTSLLQSIGWNCEISVTTGIQRVLSSFSGQ